MEQTPFAETVTIIRIILPSVARHFPKQGDFLTNSKMPLG